MKAKVYVTLKSGVLDPQGQAVAHALLRLGFPEVRDVRVGRLVELELQPAAEGGAAALSARVEEMGRKLLSNPVIEDFRVELVDEEGPRP